MQEDGSKFKTFWVVGKFRESSGNLLTDCLKYKGWDIILPKALGSILTQEYKNAYKVKLREQWKKKTTVGAEERAPWL